MRTFSLKIREKAKCATGSGFASSSQQFQTLQQQRQTLSKQQPRQKIATALVIVTRASSSSYLNHSLSIVTESGFKVIFSRPESHCSIFRGAVAIRV